MVSSPDYSCRTHAGCWRVGAGSHLILWNAGGPCFGEGPPVPPVPQEWTALNINRTHPASVAR